ncbi:sigma-70 family RNA polymerase sigma factor [Pseudoalteromonas phenolica]|uniref:RNA polymerase sigma factor n=1 Tax=Pseudoalteromonas phenolica TaxID=161398 RepID=A0A5S3YW83_9GAMM|nr:sigma-70 family RNA polymerase sigma factor [Pseudoalteromonas phenolica]TMP81550.1 sigma-70 family RNA polymerase sigma factor [Pseudoalteromonas phenolica]
MFNTAKKHKTLDDAALVLRALGGNKNAFCEIVERYQTLLCSLAYSAVGDIKYSEDLAQDAFVEAWRKLDTLHDPNKLKAWLCGILKFKISHHYRKQASNAEKHSEQLDSAEHIGAENAELEANAISAQQQTLMWQVLEQLDDTYRAPLILFYREQQSVERVASELDLSVDTVKQRLSRGRKMMKEAVTALVEVSLKHSKPGLAFTSAVMSAISEVAPPAKAAAGLGAFKAGAGLNFASIMAVSGSASGVVSAYFGLRASLDQSRTEREISLVKKSVFLFMLIAALYVGVLLLLKPLASAQKNYIDEITLVAHFSVFMFVAAYFWLVKHAFNAMKQLRAQERLFNPDAFSAEQDKPYAKQREYISPIRLFGLPLIHMQFAMPEQTDNPAVGWIAGGSKAYGLLFAWGGLAVAPISVGIISFGILSVGAVGIGLLAAGTVAIGGLAFGASAIGYQAFSSLSSLAWQGAVSGGFAVAVNGAIGAIAYAEQANNELAAQLTNLSFINQYYAWVLGLIAVFVIVPAVWHSNKVRTRMRKSALK